MADPNSPLQVDSLLLLSRARLHPWHRRLPAALIREHKELNAALLPLEKAEVPDNLEEATRLHIRRVCDKCIGNITKAANALGVSRNTVRKYLE